MKSLAIVSTYSESCGNAAFTKVLHDTIEKYSDTRVEVLELDLKLLQSTNGKVRARGDQHIRNLAEQLKLFDAVNIQMEAGLFGTLPHDITRRTAILMRANPNTSVTFHSPRLVSAMNSNTRAGIKKLLQLRLKAGIREIIDSKLSDIHIEINKRIIKNGIRAKCRFIVHTLRAKNQIKAFFDYDNVDVHPLKIVPDDFVPNPEVLGALRKDLKLEDDDCLIGMFGYISSYKGHVDALNAMKHLPNNFKLLIFGRQHPQTLKGDGQVDAYLGRLIKTVETKKWLNKRVFFMGELNDDDFLNVASAVDVAWLPYYENGQDGSGIAAICLDACPRVLGSTSFAFNELVRLVPYDNLTRFDIGNHLEMAIKTEMILERDLPVAPYGDQTVFNMRSQALAYAKELAA